MSNLVSSLRAALVADLAAQFPSAEVLSGPRSGVSHDKTRIAVFWPGFAEMPSRVVVGEAMLLIRYWPRRPKERNAVSPPNPTELEQAGWDLADFLQTKQRSYSATGAWFVRVVSVTPNYDPDEWRVEAVLRAQFSNPAVV